MINMGFPYIQILSKPEWQALRTGKALAAVFDPVLYPHFMVAVLLCFAMHPAHDEFYSW